MGRFEEQRVGLGIRRVVYADGRDGSLVGWKLSDHWVGEDAWVLLRLSERAHVGGEYVKRVG